MPLLSYTEISKALSCEHQWDLAYGGHAAGGKTFKKKEIGTHLSAGSAWGAGVAVWHTTGDLDLANGQILLSIQMDAAQMIDSGLTVETSDINATAERVGACLAQYAEELPRYEDYDYAEEELTIPLFGEWAFGCYVDGRTHQQGSPWLVENKFRSQLTDREQIERGPQYRWYALAYAITHNIDGPVGVIVEERLNRAPDPPKINKPTKQFPEGKVSSDKGQYTTGDLYLAACAERGQEPDMETAQAFDSRTWQHRVPLLFMPEELAAAREELTSAVLLIEDLMSGVRKPIRVGARQACSMCDYKPLCLNPHDSLAQQMYNVTVPKHERGPKPEGAR